MYIFASFWTQLSWNSRLIDLHLVDCVEKRQKWNWYLNLVTWWGWWWRHVTIISHGDHVMLVSSKDKGPALPNDLGLVNVRYANGYRHRPFYFPNYFIDLSLIGFFCSTFNLKIKTIFLQYLCITWCPENNLLKDLRDSFAQKVLPT